MVRAQGLRAVPWSVQAGLAEHDRRPRPEPVSRGHAGRRGSSRKRLTGPSEQMGKITVPFVMAQNPDGGTDFTGNCPPIRERDVVC